MDNILEILKYKYFEEGRRLVLDARHLLNEIEKDFLSVMIHADDLFRIMHTLKGNSGMFGQPEVEEISKRLEIIYNSLRKEEIKISSGIIELTFDCLNQIDALLENESSNKNILKKNQKSLLSKLNIRIAESTDALSPVQSKHITGKSDFGSFKNTLKSLQMFLAPAFSIRLTTSMIYLLFPGFNF